MAVFILITPTLPSPLPTGRQASRGRGYRGRGKKEGGDETSLDGGERKKSSSHSLLLNILQEVNNEN
jgi:hypothetical protein